MWLVACGTLQVVAKQMSEQTFTFHFEPLFGVYGRIILVLTGGIGLFFLFFIVPEVSLGWAVGILGCISILLLFGFYLSWRHSGTVHLTGDSVQIQRRGQNRSARYVDVINVRLADFHLPPNFILQTGNKKLMISHRLTYFPLFYYRLRAKMPLLRQQEVVPFPFARRVSQGHQWQTMIGSALYLLLTWGFVGALFFGLGDFAEAMFANQVIVVGMMMITAAIVSIPLYVVLAKERLTGFTATEEALQLHLWRGETTVYEIDDIQRICIDERENLLRVVPKQAYNDYILMIELKNGKELWFDESHARKWGSSVEMLFFNFHHLYKHTQINFHILHRQIYS